MTSFTSSALSQWLWSNLLKIELHILKEEMNTSKVRYDRNKRLPSGVSPNEVYALPGKWGLQDCLRPVDVSLIPGMKESLGGEALLKFVDDEYDSLAWAAYAHIGSPPITRHNIWDIFKAMLPCVHIK